MKKILPLIILVFFATSIFAQFHQGKIKQKHYLQVIPYQEIKGWIVVPVTINGKSYNFILDTGAPLVLSDKLFNELNLQVISQINPSDIAGERKEMRLILLPEIDLQGITFLNTQGAVFNEDFYWAEWSECLGIDGLIGSNMLRHSVVQFDEQNKQIIIADHIKKLSLQTNEYQKIKLAIKGNNPFVPVILQKGMQTSVRNVLFDTGDANAFFTLSLGESGSGVDIITENEGFFGIGAHRIFRKQKHALLNIPELVVNKMRFNDVIATTTHARESRIGVKLLQYGKITLDYKKKRFYFEPFNNINTNKPVETPWSINITFQNDKFVVGIIWDKTLESQINIGDEVLSINGIDIQFMSFCEWCMLEIPENDKRIYELKDINTGEIKTIEIERVHP